MTIGINLLAGEKILDRNGGVLLTFQKKWQELLDLARKGDPRITQAENVVASTYGDQVSVSAKRKNLNKFGRNTSVASSAFETVSEWQGSVTNETFVTTNLIDSIVSSSPSDTTQTITIEGLRS